MNSLFDIGVNLTSSAFDGRRNDVLVRAQQAGVKQQIFIGSDIADSRKAIELCKQYPDCYATAGIHPHQAKTMNDLSMETHCLKQWISLTRLTMR